MLKVVPTKSESRKGFELRLDEIAREGARRLVVRNGVAKPRTITVGSGSFDIQAPRVDDRRDGEKFLSNILPPYLRKSPKVESLLPILYLKGLSTSDFKSALSEFLGEGTMGLSSASIVKLKKIWESEFAIWETRKITKKYAYIVIHQPTSSIELWILSTS